MNVGNFSMVEYSPRGRSCNPIHTCMTRSTLRGLRDISAELTDQLASPRWGVKSIVQIVSQRYDGYFPMTQPQGILDQRPRNKPDRLVI